MLHRKYPFDLHHLKMLAEDDEQLQGEYRITDQEAVRCELSIPEEFVPTPHKDFIKDLEEQHESKNLQTRKLLLSKHASGDGMFAISGKALLVRERERKLR